MLNLFKNGYFKDPQVAIRELKEQGVLPTLSNVHFAASMGNLKQLEMLDRAGVDMLALDDQGRNFLHYALVAKQDGVLPFIFEKGIDCSTRDEKGRTPLSIAFDNGLYDVAESLIKNGAKPDYFLPNGEQSLPGYYKANRFDEVSFLLENGANPSSLDLDGRSLLAIALQNSDPGFACKLLEKGADPNVEILGEPALYSVLKRYKEWSMTQEQLVHVTDTLLSSGADSEAAGENGERVVQIALRKDLRSASNLIFPRIKNVSKTLWLAIGNDNIEAVSILLRKGSSPVEVGGQGDSPLIYAVRHHKLELVKALLSYGVNPNVVDSKGVSPLMLAIRDDQFEFVDVLLSHRADPNHLGQEGQNALFTAIAMKKNEAAKALLNHHELLKLEGDMEHPVSESFRDLFGNDGLFDYYCRFDKELTPLMAAVMMKNLIITERLLGLGVNKYNGSFKKVYPIQMAAANHDVKMQQLIIGVPYQDDKQVRKFVIDLSEQKVRYYNKGSLVKTSYVSTGRKGYRTPTGEYVITDKTRDKRSNIYDDSPMPYFQRFSCKAIGFHEGNTGSPYASHGCIRLPRSTAKYFWSKGKIGDRVIIKR